jgi:hypothetical protein
VCGDGYVTVGIRDGYATAAEVVAAGLGNPRTTSAGFGDPPVYDSHIHYVLVDAESEEEARTRVAEALGLHDSWGLRDLIVRPDPS